MHNTTYNTPLVISGPFKSPKQMLANQEYDGHKSLHDGEVASGLGLKDAPIEGPTHFSQFVPMLVTIWGETWYEQGCFSAHFKNMVIEGEQVKAFVEMPKNGATTTRCWAEKADGTLVLEASASIGKQDATLLEQRLERLKKPTKLVILEDLKIGLTSPKPETIKMEADQHMGALYPFTLTEKLKSITENSPIYSNPVVSPWQKAVIPLEMVSVLAAYSSHQAEFSIKQPVIGLFADLEIRMIQGPLFVGETYTIKREIIALGESRQTEGFWTLSTIYDKEGKEALAEVLLHQAFFKQSYPHYPKAEDNA